MDKIGDTSEGIYTGMGMIGIGCVSGVTLVVDTMCMYKGTVG